MLERDEIRISLPSKGRLAEETVEFMAACGLKVHKPNPRQYAASIPALPGLTVLFQRPTDIVTSVRDGSVDFGITGLDVTKEHGGTRDEILVLHEALGFGGCRLAVAVPESWAAVRYHAHMPAGRSPSQPEGVQPGFALNDEVPADAPLVAKQRTQFLATFDKVRRNATAQLERERAFAEIDRP
mgnify:CR=1 FL=1